MNEESVLEQREKWLADVRDCLSEFGYHPHAGMIAGHALVSQIRKMRADLEEARRRVIHVEAAFGRLALKQEEVGRG